MAEAAGETQVVPTVGDRVRIVFQGYYEGVPLAGRTGYELGTEHTVTEVPTRLNSPCENYGYFLNDDTWVLPEEIEVIQ